MTGEIKILLTSDLHLGVPDNRSGIPSQVRLSTFKKILSLARDHDLLLVAGDLFDHSHVEGDLLMDVKEEFLRLEESGTSVLLVPGLGETDETGHVADMVRTLPVQKVFSGDPAEGPWTFSCNGLNLFVYGLPVMQGKNIGNIEKSDEPGFHIGLFYMDLKDEEDAGPVHSIRTRDLKNLPFDFCALGHCHHFRLFKISERILAVYPGSPEAVECDETGDRYVVSIIIRDHRIHLIRRFTVNSLRLHEEVVDVTTLRNLDSIAGIAEKHRSPQVIFTARLRGKRTFDIPADPGAGWVEGFHSVRLEDETVPGLDYLLKRYSGEDTLRGEFFRIISSMINNGTMPDFGGYDELAVFLYRMIKNDSAGPEDILCDL